MRQQRKISKDNQKGGALLWVILAMMIAVLFLGVIYAAVESFANRQAYSRDNRQAYLTARSICNAVAEVLVSKKDEDFVQAVKGLQDGATLQLENFTFQSPPQIDEQGKDPSLYMEEVNAYILRETKDTIKIIAKAEVGKGYEQVGIKLNQLPGGSSEGDFYFNDGEAFKNTIRTDENTSIVIDSELVLPKVNESWANPIIQIGKDLKVKGSVSLSKNIAGDELQGYINGKIIATGDVELKTLRVGTEGNPNGGIYTTGNVIIRECGSQQKMKIHGKIACNKLIIHTSIEELPKLDQENITYLIDANIDAKEGVYIKEGANGIEKRVSFSSEEPKDPDVLWVEDLREGKNIVFTGTTEENIKMPVIAEAPGMPLWVSVADAAHKIETSPYEIPELESGKTYLIKVDGNYEITASLGKITATPENPATIIIPEGANIAMGSIPGVKRDEITYPCVRIIVERGATLKLNADVHMDINDTYVHIYGRDDTSEIQLNAKNFYGSIIGGSSKHGNDGNGDVKYHYVGDIGLGASSGSSDGRFQIDCYVPK